jgi:hypothetical protein
VAAYRKENIFNGPVKNRLMLFIVHKSATSWCHSKSGNAKNSSLFRGSFCTCKCTNNFTVCFERPSTKYFVFLFSVSTLRLTSHVQSTSSFFPSRKRHFIKYPNTSARVFRNFVCINNTNKRRWKSKTSRQLISKVVIPIATC